MALRTRVQTISQLKELFVEGLINNTTKLSKVSDGSVNNGVSFGVSKIAQRAQKDIALVESRLFPSLAFDVYLDDAAIEQGVAPRFAATNSSTYLLLVGSPGTVYIAVTNVFTGSGGVTFNLVNDVTIPTVGYTYALVRSAVTGSRTNSDPLTISKVSPAPVGHQYVINEFAALNGADSESDNSFKLRIRDTPNIIATDTLGRLTQVFIKFNSKVMRLFYYGITDAGQTKIGILTQDASPLSTGELNDILEKSAGYLALSDLKPFGTTQYGILLLNIDWYPIDIEFRVDIHLSFSADDVRKAIQVAINKYLDFTAWTPVKKVEWDDLLSIVKNTEGVKYCPDTYFIPRVDINISNLQLPRVRGFVMKDLSGNIISDGGGTLNPTFFPNRVNASYQATVLVTA